jgi:hypothetical protein
MNKKSFGKVLVSVKKLKYILASSVLFLSTATAASAVSGPEYTAGKFTYEGQDTFTSKSKVIYSGGGSFKVCMTGGSGVHEVTLMEYDGSASADDKVGIGLLTNGSCKTWSGLTDRIDGENNKAEFYITKDTGNSITVKFYD